MRGRQQPRAGSRGRAGLRRALPRPHELHEQPAALRLHQGRARRRRLGPPDRRGRSERSGGADRRARAGPSGGRGRPRLRAAGRRRRGAARGVECAGGRARTRVAPGRTIAPGVRRPRPLASMPVQRFVRPVGLIVVAAVVGFVLARILETPSRPADALTRTATTGPLALHYPGNWMARTAVTLRGLSLAAPVSIGPRDSHAEHLTIGTMHATSLGTLPAAFLASLPHRPTPQVVPLGPYRFDRYLELRPRGAGAVVSVYLLATTRATVIASCSSPRPSARFTAAC